MVHECYISILEGRGREEVGTRFGLIPLVLLLYRTGSLHFEIEKFWTKLVRFTSLIKNSELNWFASLRYWKILDYTGSLHFANEIFWTKLVRFTSIMKNSELNWCLLLRYRNFSIIDAFVCLRFDINDITSTYSTKGSKKISGRLVDRLPSSSQTGRRV